MEDWEETQKKIGPNVSNPSIPSMRSKCCFFLGNAELILKTLRGRSP